MIIKHYFHMDSKLIITCVHLCHVRSEWCARLPFNLVMRPPPSIYQLTL